MSEVTEGASACHACLDSRLIKSAVSSKGWDMDRLWARPQRRTSPSVLQAGAPLLLKPLPHIAQPMLSIGSPNATRVG